MALFSGRMIDLTFFLTDLALASRFSTVFVKSSAVLQLL
jgi:hypothetical protein